MKESTPDPAASQKDAQKSISGDAAIDAVNEAMAILPKKRLGCLRRVAKYCAVLAVLLAALAYWNLLRTPQLKISKETTYITEPLTSDGTRVDYFTAYKQEFYPAKMKTDDNGYRLIVRALGDVSDHQLSGIDGKSVKCDAEIATARLYQELGLDPTVRPTMTHQRPMEYLTDYVAQLDGAGQSPEELDQRLHQPWTLDDLPMMESWLQENQAILDLMAQAVRKPVFTVPLIRYQPEAALYESLVMGHIHRVRAFARSIEARANYRIGIGDIDGAIEDLVTLKHLGRHMGRQGSAVHLLVGIAVEGMADAIQIAGNGDSQPTAEQLRRLVDELGTVPSPANMDRFWLAVRYHELSGIQAMAYDNQLLTDQLSIWDNNEAYQPGITTNLPLDWNIIMRRINAAYDDMGNGHVGLPPQGRSSWDVFLGARSRRVADYLACLSPSATSAIAEAYRRSGCSNNLRQIALAMLLYDHEHGSLPPAWTLDGDGVPLHSWRVLLLPYLGEESLFAQIRLNEPWDSEHNRQFHNQRPSVYACASAVLEPDETAYSVIAGEQAAFQPGVGRSLDDFGMDLMLVVERSRSACWMDPASELDDGIARKVVSSRSEDEDGIGCEHPAIVLVAARDGSTQFIRKDVDASVLQSLLEGTADRWPTH
jgi:hypothetical protein